MESIGKLAHRTGTSARMLRHWESLGLLSPAYVDPHTGHRRYSAAQAGRVRAIGDLRTAGFGLDSIRHLLAQGLTEPRLVELLQQRENELAQQIADASAAIAKVRARLQSIEKGRHTIMNTLDITTLPEVRLPGVAENVADETEIAAAVVRLLDQLRVDPHALETDVLLTYDGTTNETVITVSAAPVGAGPHHETSSGSTTVVAPAAPTAAIAFFDEVPISIGDAWITLDTALEDRGLSTTGPYRQTLHVAGGTTLAAPTQQLS